MRTVVMRVCMAVVSVNVDANERLRLGEGQ